jgi:hypothetical protein
MSTTMTLRLEDDNASDPPAAVRRRLPWSGPMSARNWKRQE